MGFSFSVSGRRAIVTASQRGASSSATLSPNCWATTPVHLHLTWGVSHALAKSFLNGTDVLSRMLRSPGKEVTSGLFAHNAGHRSGQLIIGELVQEVQCLLPGRQVIRCQHLHAVVVVLLHMGLIEAGDGHHQPL